MLFKEGCILWSVFQYFSSIIIIYFHLFSLFFIYLQGVKKTEISIRDFEDIVIGTSQEEIHKKFGEPRGTLSGMRGYVYILNHKEIIIYYNSNENKEWLVNEVKIGDVDE